MSFINQALSFFSIGPTRSFAGISGYVTLSESTNDDLEITQQPVQTGATISDHCYKKPVTLNIQIQFGNTASLTNGFGLFGGQSLNDIYQNLIQLQEPIPPNVVTPFTVSTLKRTYQNMLLKTLVCNTDKKTENVLSITAAFQQVILVPIGQLIVPASRLKNAKNNLGTKNVGTKSALATTTGTGAVYNNTGSPL